MRLALASALLVLAARLPHLHAETAIHAYMWLQAIGFGLLQWRVAPANQLAPMVGYGLFPFILATQLSLLPLPWLRGLLAVMAPAAQLAVMLATQGESNWNEALLFVLIVLVVAWASHAQLRLLVDLHGFGFQQPLAKGLGALRDGLAHRGERIHQIGAVLCREFRDLLERHHGL